MYFVAFIGIIKSWSRGLAKYDDDDKVGENFEEKFDFDVSLIFLPGAGEKKKNLLFVDLNVEENDLYNLIVIELV